MRCSNALFVVFFIAVVLFQISKNVLGYWSIGVYLLVILASFHLCQRYIRNYAPTGSCRDFPNLWPFLFSTGRNAYCNLMADGPREATDSLTICLVCGEMNCEKHDPELAVLTQPWKHLLVDAKVNAELERLFAFLLEQHTPWLGDIAHNQAEIRLELKRIIRLVTASLLLRAKNRLQWSEIIFRKLPKYLTHHLEMYIYGKRKAKSARFLEESVLRQYGSLLHPAVVSAQNEAKFLKSVADLILHTSLPFKYAKCDVSYSFLNEFICSCILSPLIDILIDPDKINTVLIFLFDKKDKAHTDYVTGSDDDKVEFLSGFVDLKSTAVCSAPDHLGTEKKQIFEDQHLLFLFSQFAHEEQFLNVLQFVLHLNKFMNQITNPDLSNDQLLSLQQHLANVHELYLVSTSKDYIRFEPSIVAGFAEAVNGNYAQIQQFRNSKSLYEAYEYANEILEFYIHKFFHTDVYLKLICGQRSLSFTAGYEEFQRQETGNGDKSQIRQTKDTKRDHDLLTSGAALEGQTATTETLADIDVDSVDIFLGGIPDDVKDLNVFTVNILNVITKYDLVGREVFYFELETVQPEGPRWLVERQFGDFFSLASKLKEFHGDELDDFLLPTRRFLRANKSLMESYRYDLELFLRDLLNNETLKRSELVYNFLTADEFSYGYFGDNFNFGKMIKNVPSKFSKERGQHLYSFMRNFIDSCHSRKGDAHEEDCPAEGGCSSSSTLTEPEQKRERRRRSSARSHLDSNSEFLDLSGTANAAKGSSSMTNADRISSHLEYLYDQVLLVLIRFYSVNKYILELLYLLRPLLRQSFQVLCEYLVGRQLQRNLLTPSKMCQLIGELRRLLQHSGEADEETSSLAAAVGSLTKSQRSQKALRVATEFVPRWLVEQLVDYNQHEHFVFLLFSLLQHRLLNKQLLYLLANSLLDDLFPEPIYQTID